jgi:hypothetical protein
MGLIGDDRRWATLDFLRVKHDRDRLAHEREAIRDAIRHSMHTLRGVEQRVVVSQLTQRFDAVQREWVTAASRAANLAQQLGRLP